MHVPADPPPTPSAIATIGVYGFAGNSFLERLPTADVRLVLDVRQRRGVRGPQYAWANSRRLQDALAAASLGYRHHPELAPTTELRQLQYAEDARLGVGKRSRVELAPEYVRRYTSEVLDRVDLTALVTALPAPKASPRSSASSATQRPATAPSSPPVWPTTTVSRSSTCAPDDGAVDQSQKPSTGSPSPPPGRRPPTQMTSSPSGPA